MTYRQTLIAVAEDCPVQTAQIPQKAGLAAFQYAMLAGRPSTYTQDEVLFRSHYRNQNKDWDVLRAAHWQAFFAQPRACLRTSPLPKKFGWGLYFDAEGKITLLGREDYQRLLADESVKVVKAMRSKREKPT